MNQKLLDQITLDDKDSFIKLFKDCETSEEFFRKISKLFQNTKYITLISHSSKMTHPDVSSPSFKSVVGHYEPGYIYSGCCEVPIDFQLSATYFPTAKLLMLKYKGVTIFEYILKKDLSTLKKIFSVDEETIQDWLKRIKFKPQNYNTDRRLKQVYFPIADENYHLLTVLIPSGLVFKLKDRIDEIRFGEKNRHLRQLKKNGESSDESYMDISQLTLTKYGGAHPQNISFLNNIYAGQAYLLHSMPPMLKKRNVRFPKRDFFKESLSWGDFADLFDAIAKLAQTDYNNVHMREGRKKRYRQIVETIVERMWEVRSVAQEQYIQERSKLLDYQKVWLLHTAGLSEQPEDESWLEALQKEIVRWIIGRLEFKLGKEFLLGPEERRDIENIVSEYEEMLR